MTPKNRFARRKEQTRSALQAAAQALILRNGFAAVTVDAIVQKADVARGTFYLHYRDKEELVWDIVKSHLQAIDAQVEHRMPTTGNLREYQLAGIAAAFENAARNRKLHLLILGPQGSAAVAHRFHQHIAQETEREIAAGHVYAGVDVPAPVLAQFFAGALLRLMVWWLESRSDMGAGQMAALTLKLLHQLPASN